MYCTLFLSAFSSSLWPLSPDIVMITPSAVSTVPDPASPVIATGERTRPTTLCSTSMMAAVWASIKGSSTACVAACRMQQIRVLSRVEVHGAGRTHGDRTHPVHLSIGIMLPYRHIQRQSQHSGPAGAQEYRRVSSASGSARDASHRASRTMRGTMRCCRPQGIHC